MAILCQVPMTNFNKIAIIAVLVWVYIAMNMVNISVFAKNRKYVANLHKQNGINHIGKKVIAKTKYTVKKG